jgi:hypothetical protein
VKLASSPVIEKSSSVKKGRKNLKSQLVLGRRQEMQRALRKVELISKPLNQTLRNKDQNSLRNSISKRGHLDTADLHSTSLLLKKQQQRNTPQKKREEKKQIELEINNASPPPLR